MTKIITKNICINRFNLKHNFKYNYDEFIYTDCKTKSVIKCPIHGKFKQSASQHFIGGCFNCAREITGVKNLLTYEKFVKKATKLHNNKYSYDEFIFIDRNTKGMINCNICKDKFLQSPGQHLKINRNGGCRKCASNKPYTNESFINEANKIHENFYNYSKFNYVNMHKPGIIICPIHNEFSQIPADHIYNEAGCPICAGNMQLTNDIVDDRFKKLEFTRIGDYINLFTNIKLSCNKCDNIWSALPSNIFRRPCPFCVDNSKRKNEKLIYTHLTKNKINFKYQFQLNILEKLNKKLRADFYLPDVNIIIEYNGHQHYQPVCFGNYSLEQAKINFDIQIERDNLVKDICNRHNIKLINIDGRKFTNFKLKEFIEKELILELKGSKNE